MKDIPIGTIAQYKDQRFELSAIKPHVRPNGGATSYLVWRTHCLDCGSETEISTSRSKFRNGTLEYPKRRCPEHTKRRPAKNAP